VRGVRVFGYGGNDYISHNVAGINAAIHGGDGADDLHGDAGRDYLNGGAGNDTLHGWGGNDTLVGGPNHDNLYGGDGYDHLYGGAGNDWLDAGSRPEPAVGGPGWDANAHIWAYNGARATDINQLASSTCVFLSSLAGIARTGLVDLASRISCVGEDTYTVRLFVNGFWRDVEVWYNGSFTMDANGTYDCGFDQEGEFWQILYQRAYMITIDFDPYSVASMASFKGEWTGEQALTTISGWTSQTAAINATLTPGALQDLIRDGYAVQGRYDRHDYAFTNVFQSGGTWFVRIYDPYGWDGNRRPNLRPLPDGVSDGFLTITWANFMATFTQYSYA
jgi:RTX calcium-binding nonapeptide repeat (4 copies)